MKNDKTKGFGLEAANGEVFNKVCLSRFPTPKFPVSDEHNAFLPPGTGRMPFKWENYLRLSGNCGARLGEVKVTFLPFSQTLSAYTLQYAGVSDFGVVCPELIKVFHNNYVFQDVQSISLVIVLEALSSFFFHKNKTMSIMN